MLRLTTSTASYAMESGVPSSSRGQRTLAAIVITDAVGFSARMSTQEEKTLTMIERDLQLMQTLCQRFEGRVLKSTGDGLLMSFVSAVQAVNCAIQIQKTLIDGASNLSVNDFLLHRIGIHLGDVFFSENDVMGNGVNIAARLQTEADAGGICLSETTYNVVKSPLKLDANYLGPLNLKNIQEPVPAYQILPSSSLSSAPTEPQSAGDMSVIPANTVINDRYKIKAVLGQGGFGRSYLAEDAQRFDELCVLKEFLPSSRADYVVEKAKDLFQREAKILYQVTHPQIPDFLAWFTEGERIFIVQEYIPGKTYSELLKERKKNGQSFSETEIVRWLGSLLPVLDYLHGINIVHRDISPDNMMFSEAQNKPVLIDFGLVKQTIAKIYTSSSGDDQKGSYVGKIGYAPPEQMRLGQCSPCSDLYALGVTAIVLLTGKEPNLLISQQTLEWEWQSNVNVSDAFAVILNKMLEEKPKNRYQSAQEVLAVLQGLSEGGAAGATEPTEVTHQDDEDDVATSPLHSQTEIQSRTRIQSPDLTPKLTPPTGLNPEFITRCQMELARCIGPMADVVLEDVLAESSHLSPHQFIQALADEIPMPQKAKEFKQNLS